MLLLALAALCAKDAQKFLPPAWGRPGRGGERQVASKCPLCQGGIVADDPTDGSVWRKIRVQPQDEEI